MEEGWICVRFETWGGRLAPQARATGSDVRTNALRSTGPLSAVVALDLELVGLARRDVPTRFEIGRGLDALAARGGHHELGFSSFVAYAVERCRVSGAWANESRRVAVASPGIRDRAAVLSGASRSRAVDCSLCTQCHLFGVRAGALSVSAPASHMRWTLGREAILEIDWRRARGIAA